MKNIINLQKKLQNDHDLASNLFMAMQKNGINEAELARRTQIPQPTLHKILAGKTEDPRYSTLQQLASFFDLTVDELVSGTESAHKQTETNRVHAVPIVSWRDCLRGSNFINNLSTKEWKDWVSIENSPIGGFAIGTTACAEPRFPKGTILIIDPNAIPQDGDLIIAQYQKAEEASLRELSIDGPNKFLLSINPNVTKDVYNKTTKILGIVVEYRFSFI